ncbi:MAG TPA: hypothetical protein VMS74_15750 [Acidimicrobiia bacterium]|nr:hypothetical protein [Acidimicrobiia bacterium]
MSPESETAAALKRAGARAAFHLLRAGVESLKALEAVIDELGKVGSRRGEDDDEPDGPVRIEIE